jgi:hypothetical protein
MKTLAQLNAEAKRDPFVLGLGGSDGTVTFPQPTFGQAVDASQEAADVVSLLRAYALEADRDKLEKALRASAATVPQQVLDMVHEAFGMGNPAASPSS